MDSKRRLVMLLGIAACCSALTVAQTAPTSVFQLNGSAGAPTVNTCTYGGVGSQTCDNWNLLNGTGNNIAGGGVGAGSSPGHSVVRTFINGTSSTFSFQGGGSKDANPLSQWSYAVTGSPNKDTIDAAYTAAYTQGGDFNLIFGADRLSPNGDANIGIWFFQQAVTTNASGGFTGAHVDHDIFVISAFTGGGGTSGIAVYEWDHTCASAVKNPGAGQCADTNLRVLATAAASGVCGTAPYCAVTNGSTTNSSWEGNLATPLFFEGGVNLTAAFAAVGITQLPCFSSFLVETRSSQSTSAVLKDFLVGGFPVCGLSITKNCGTATVNAAGTLVNYPVSGTVKNTGVGKLYNVTVFDTIGNSTTPNQILVVNNTAGSPDNGSHNLGPGDTGSWSDSSTSSQLSQSDSAIAKGATDSAVGATLSVTSGNTATATCSTSVTTSLSVTKNCSPGTTLVGTGSVVQVQVGFSGQVCNNGTSQVTGVTLKDYPGTSTTGTTVASNITLAPSGSPGACQSYSGSYTPTSIDITTLSGTNAAGTGPGRFFFNDLITISNATATIGTLTALSNQTEARCNATYGCAPASCPLCQGSGECTP